MPMELPWCVCVSMNLKVLCLRMKSSIMCTIWGGGQFMECLCIGTWGGFFFDEVKKMFCVFDV